MAVHGVIGLAVLEFLHLAIVPVLDGAVVAGDTAVDLGLLAADRTGVLFARQIAVFGTDRIGRAERIVGQMVVVRDLLHELHGSLPIRQFLTQEAVEYSAGCVENLQTILYIKGRENVLGVANRQVGAVGVVGSAVLIGGDDVRVALLIVFGEPVGRGFGRSGFQIIQIAVFFLVVRQTFSHMIENFFGEVLRLLVGHVLAQPAGVQTSFVHADQADGGEMVVEVAQVELRIRIQACVEPDGQGFALDMQALGSQVHQFVQTLEEFFLALGQVGQAGHVQRDNADRTGGFAGAEEAAGLLA